MASRDTSLDLDLSILPRDSSFGSFLELPSGASVIYDKRSHINASTQSSRLRNPMRAHDAVPLTVPEHVKHVKQARIEHAAGLRAYSYVDARVVPSLHGPAGATRVEAAAARA
jgi:hypothetical protein